MDVSVHNSLWNKTDNFYLAVLLSLTTVTDYEEQTEESKNSNSEDSENDPEDPPVFSEQREDRDSDSSMISGCNGSTGEEVRETGCLEPESSEVLGAIGRRAGMAGQDRLVVVGGRGDAGGALIVGLVALMVTMFSLEGIEGREPELGLVAGTLALLWAM
ncbi:hypothetical protein E2C01_021509 [Portunus trituberculatus]|uniref:Uncharacterized protein n=1 Tax=Portunus trituberculatus TaxID=210409 RepID=A0A5B7E3G2_PORTR|nr:hypothetical protein [Portunus trituberculatus]